jgi:hypothetical protein
MLDIFHEFSIYYAIKNKIQLVQPNAARQGLGARRGTCCQDTSQLWGLSIVASPP